MTDKLLPCPFCGGGETLTKELVLDNTPRMDGKPSEVISVAVHHWCEKMDGVVARHIEFRGRDRDTAIAAWNRRTGAIRAEVLEEAARVAETAGNTWSGSRDLATCDREAAVDEKCVEIAAAIRELKDKL